MFWFSCSIVFYFILSESSIGKNSCSIVGLVPDLFVWGMPLSSCNGFCFNKKSTYPKRKLPLFVWFNSCLLGCFCSSKFGFASQVVHHLFDSNLVVTSAMSEHWHFRKWIIDALGFSTNSILSLLQTNFLHSQYQRF